MRIRIGVLGLAPLFFLIPILILLLLPSASFHPPPHFPFAIPRMAAFSAPPQPQTFHPDLTELDCGPFENVPVSHITFSPSPAMTD